MTEEDGRWIIFTSASANLPRRSQTGSSTLGVVPLRKSNESVRPLSNLPRPTNAPFLHWPGAFSFDFCWATGLHATFSWFEIFTRALGFFSCLLSYGIPRMYPPTIHDHVITDYGKKRRCWSYMCPPLPQASLAHLRCFFCLLGSWVFARGVLFFHSHRFDFFYIFFDMHSINTLGHFGSLKNKVCID